MVSSGQSLGRVSDQWARWTRSGWRQDGDGQLTHRIMLLHDYRVRDAGVRSVCRVWLVVFTSDESLSDNDTPPYILAAAVAVITVGKTCQTAACSSYLLAVKSSRYFAPGSGAKYCDQCVCLFDCLFVSLAHMSQKHVQISQNILYTFPVAVDRSFSDGNAKCYVLPYLRMSLFIILCHRRMYCAKSVENSQKTNCACIRLTVLIKYSCLNLFI